MSNFDEFKQEMLRKREEAQRRLSAVHEQQLYECNSIVQELAEKNVLVEGIAELQGTDLIKQDVMSILISYLEDQEILDETKIVISRLLGRRKPTDDGVGVQLLRVFSNPALNANVRDQLGLSLGLIVSADDADYLEEVILNESLGEARHGLVFGLVRLRKSEAASTLLRVIGQKKMAPDTLVALGKTRNPIIRETLEAYAQSSDSEIRKSAKSALKRFA